MKTIFRINIPAAVARNRRPYPESILADDPAHAIFPAHLFWLFFDLDF